MSEDDDKTRILRSSPVDDGKTRILPGARSPAAAEDDDGGRTRILPNAARVAAKPSAVVAPAGKPGDRIIFQCPNGHRIIVGRQFAGKRGKCNKCGADVLIPRGSPSGPPSTIIGPPPEDAADESESAENEEASTEDDAPSLDQLSFGDGPPRAAEPADELLDLGMEKPTHREDTSDISEFNFEEPVGKGTADAESPIGLPDLGGDEINPTAVLVARLWLERDHGGVVELHLDGGAVLLPQWYESKWSRGTHGLFASQAPDGSVTLTAVAWESVKKVVVRQLAAVPDDMFT